LRIGLNTLPFVQERSGWQDIIDFKTETHDKLWHFRRFLQTLSTKKQSEAEIQDDIEWSLNEYSRAMNIHHLKASQSFVDVFVITPLEIIENLVKFNWSKIARGALSVRERKVEPMEAEMKAPAGSARMCSMRGSGLGNLNEDKVILLVSLTVFRRAGQPPKKPFRIGLGQRRLL